MAFKRLICRLIRSSVAAARAIDAARRSSPEPCEAERPDRPRAPSRAPPRARRRSGCISPPSPVSEGDGDRLCLAVRRIGARCILPSRMASPIVRERAAARPCPRARRRSRVAKLATRYAPPKSARASTIGIVTAVASAAAPGLRCAGVADRLRRRRGRSGAPSRRRSMARCSAPIQCIDGMELRGAEGDRHAAQIVSRYGFNCRFGSSDCNHGLGWSWRRRLGRRQSRWLGRRSWWLGRRLASWGRLGSRRRLGRRLGPSWMGRLWRLRRRLLALVVWSVGVELLRISARSLGLRPKGRRPKYFFGARRNNPHEHAVDVSVTRAILRKCRVRQPSSRRRSRRRQIAAETYPASARWRDGGGTA